MSGFFGSDATPAEVVAPESQVPKIESKPANAPEEVKPPEPKEDDKFASKFAALARKEKATKEREKQLADREKQLEARLAALEAEKAPAKQKPEDLRTRLRKDPFNALKDEGMDYETLTKIALNDGKLPPELQMQLMREELEAQFAERTKSLEEKLNAWEEEKKQNAAKSEEENQAKMISDFKGQIKALIESQKDNFEMVAVEGDEGIELVYETIREDAQKKREEFGDEWDGVIMTIEEAVAKVDDQILEKAKKYKELKKVQQLFGPAKPLAPSTQTTTAKPEAKEQSVTLSNSHSQAQEVSTLNMSDDEVRRIAAKQLKFIRD